MLNVVVCERGVCQYVLVCKIFEWVYVGVRERGGS